MSTTTSIVSEPSILTANTYFWTPGGNASSRRHNEDRRQGEVREYLIALGFIVSQTGDTLCGTLGNIRVSFRYSESCHNCYKSLSVTVAGKNSNISTLRKLADPDKRKGMLSIATRRANKARAEVVTARLEGKNA